MDEGPGPTEEERLTRGGEGRGRRGVIQDTRERGEKEYIG